MRLNKLALALVAATCALAPSLAEAQSAPRIIMRRPLQQSTLGTPQGGTCGTPGQPACVSDCDYVGAYWETGNWVGGACGQGVPVTRSVRCMAIARSGQNVPKPDSFCLQDADAFASSCSSTGTQN